VGGEEELRHERDLEPHRSSHQPFVDLRLSYDFFWHCRMRFGVACQRNAAESVDTQYFPPQDFRHIREGTERSWVVAGDEQRLAHPFSAKPVQDFIELLLAFQQ